MARIRTIKPEAFLDEELWDLTEESGLPIFQSFVGLWTQADREGRFEWSPRRLKAAVLPYWEGDFSRVLDALATRGFLVKYASGTRVYGLVRTFTEHQVVNNREQQSKIPAPTAEDLENAAKPRGVTRQPRVDDACGTREVHAQAEGKGREGKGREVLGGSARGRVYPPEDFVPAVVTQQRISADFPGIALDRLIEHFKSIEFNEPGDWNRRLYSFAADNGAKHVPKAPREPSAQHSHNTRTSIAAAQRFTGDPNG